MSSLLLVERFVLENVSKDGSTVNDIVKATELSSSVVQAALYHLKSQNIVTYKDGLYRLNIQQKAIWQGQINQEKNKKMEIMDLFSQLLNYYYRSEKKAVDLKLERARMDDFELKIFKSHLKNLADFFKGIKQKKEKASGQEYVFLYANSCFPSLVQSSVLN